MTAAFDAAEAARTSSDIIRAGSKSFAAASMLFAPATRLSVHQLYAWCRHCDDVIDGQVMGYRLAAATRHDPVRELAQLRQQTADALQGGGAADPVFRGLRAVFDKHAIPARHASELLDGFAIDVEGRAFATIDDTMTYCYHVAGVVGVMMAIVMGVRDDATLDRASDLGLGFQLTNIARDLVEDAEAGRCYLPLNWLAEHGLTPATMAAPENRAELARLASRLVGTADTYYASSRAGLARLPFRSSWAVGTARHVYRKIGREVERRGTDAWQTRVSTSTLQKIFAVLAGGVVSVDARSRAHLRVPTPRVGLWTRPRT